MALLQTLYSLVSLSQVPHRPSNDKYSKRPPRNYVVMLRKNGRTLATDDVLTRNHSNRLLCKGNNNYKATQDGGCRASAGGRGNHCSRW